MLKRKERDLYSLQFPSHKLGVLCLWTILYNWLRLGVSPAASLHIWDVLNEWSWIMRDMAQIGKDNTQGSFARHVFMADRPVLSNPNPFWMVLGTYVTALRLHKTSCLAEQTQGCNDHVCVVASRLDRRIHLFIYSVGESSCNFGDGMDQRVQSLMFMIMIMMIYLFVLKLILLFLAYTIEWLVNMNLEILTKKPYEFDVLCWHLPGSCLSLKDCVGIHLSNWANQTNTFQAGSCMGEVVGGDSKRERL